jgi:subtilase family protein
MPEYPHNRFHIFLYGRADSQAYVGRGGGRRHPPPTRNREEHARRLAAELTQALRAARQLANVAVQRAPDANPGYYLEFAVRPQSLEFVQSLENRQQGIELLSVKTPDPEGDIHATVFVPSGAESFFVKRIEAYRTEDTETGRPRNERLIASIDSVSLAVVRSIFVDPLDRFPVEDVPAWWEVWLRHDASEHFMSTAAILGVRVKSTERLTFPEREVVLANATVSQMARLMTGSGAVAELRVASDTPAIFLNFRNFEQAEWTRDLAQRVRLPNLDAPVVCILDSGITRTHPLLAASLRPADAHTYDPTWGTGDSAAWQGHGTAIAGVALYGDLQRRLLDHGPVFLQHGLESVKMLNPSGIQHDPTLYGAVTRECVARPEVEAPNRRRAICMAVTSDTPAPGGRPSSWSAELDTLAYGDGTNERLIITSAGNIAREDIDPIRYPDNNDLQPVQSPAQAWNALTVGGYTEKTTISDPQFRGWTPVAPAGEICPASRTSVTWQRQWPVKPEVLSEGGNWASDGNIVDTPLDLGLLTTHHQPMVQQFTTISNTSAATAAVAEIAGKMLAARPELWPESVRGLIVHSAKWTPSMRNRMDAATTQARKVAVLRRYGYGVADYTRALLSSINDVTLVAQDRLRPFKRGEARNIVGNQMNLHELPWPRAELQALGATEVEVRVTLSYYVEPNPGERGWIRRHRYASHGLRFAMQRSLESRDAFRARINKAVQLEEEDIATDAGADNWLIGIPRNVGSLHSDYWRGAAIELAARDAIAVYPVTGWWKEKRYLNRYERDARYCLIVSINATTSEVDIYTPIAVQVGIPVEIAS